MSDVAVQRVRDRLEFMLRDFVLLRVESRGSDVVATFRVPIENISRTCVVRIDGRTVDRASDYELTKELENQLESIGL